MGSILQPVLQYGPSFAGGGNYWAITSVLGGKLWSGNYYHSALRKVSTGEVDQRVDVLHRELPGPRLASGEWRCALEEHDQPHPNARAYVVAMGVRRGHRGLQYQFMLPSTRRPTTTSTLSRSRTSTTPNTPRRGPETSTFTLAVRRSPTLEHDSTCTTEHRPRWLPARREELASDRARRPSSKAMGASTRLLSLARRLHEAASLPEVMDLVVDAGGRGHPLPPGPGSSCRWSRDPASRSSATSSPTGSGSTSGWRRWTGGRTDCLRWR